MGTLPREYRFVLRLRPDQFLLKAKKGGFCFSFAIAQVGVDSEDAEHAVCHVLDVLCLSPGKPTHLSRYASFGRLALEIFRLDVGSLLDFRRQSLFGS